MHTSSLPHVCVQLEYELDYTEQGKNRQHGGGGGGGGFYDNYQGSYGGSYNYGDGYVCSEHCTVQHAHTV